MIACLLHSLIVSACLTWAIRAFRGYPFGALEQGVMLLVIAGYALDAAYWSWTTRRKRLRQMPVDALLRGGPKGYDI